MSTASASPTNGGRPDMKTDRRTLIVLAVALVITLWIADQIEMDLFMAFVAWLLIALRTVFHTNVWVKRGTVVGLLVWAIFLPFFTTRAPASSRTPRWRSPTRSWRWGST